MRCKDCLMWQNRKAHLVTCILELVPSMAHYLHKNEADKEIIALVAREAEYLAHLYKQHIFIMDTDCPSGRCVLNEWEHG